MKARGAILLLLAMTSMTAQVRLPEFTREQLPNGATLILLPKHDVPLISVRAVFRGGAEAEPAGLNGISAVTVELMRRGAGKRTAEQIDLDLDFLGATIQSGANRNAAFFALEFLSRTAPEAMSILGDILARPTFPEEEVRKVLARTADQVRAAKDNPAMAIGRYFNGAFFPAGHPYRHSGAPDESSVSRMNREEILKHFRRMATGKNLIFIAAGDFDPQQFAPLARRILTEIPAGETLPAAQPPALRFPQPRLLLVDKPDATQTYFRIGMPGIDRRHPDRIALLVVNTLFGGRFTSMLNDALRVNAGLTYGANSLLDQDRLPGAIAINSYTPTATTVQAIDLALEVLQRLLRDGITQEQLDSARAYIKGNFPTERLETADQLCALLADLELNGLDRSDVDTFFQKLDALTAAQVNAVLRRHFTADNLQFCLVGNASAIRGQVGKYAKAMKEISVKDAGFSAPDF
ncbi:MAG: insulinase family protein [Bryobacteraceae bacterium]|nr:insulinase family protein [Bryobacteraceae bacterium]